MIDFHHIHAETVAHFWDFWHELNSPTRTESEWIKMKEAENLQYPNLPKLKFPWGMFLEQAIILFVISWTYRKLIVAPLARIVFQYLLGPKRKVKTVQLIKFEQSHLEMITYSVFAYFGTIFLFKQSWIWPSLLWWELNSCTNYILNRGERFFYILYGARYFQGFITVLLEPKRKDFIEMLLHHILTVVLIYLSWMFGLVRAGMVIMWLMDLADPFLHLGKQVIYLRNAKRSKGGFFSLATAADTCFTAFAIVFLISRNVLYPYVVYSACFEPEAKETAHYVLRVLLLSLMGLQFFWAFFLLKVLQGKEVNDNRSDLSESETEDTKKTQ